VLDSRSRSRSRSDAGRRRLFVPDGVPLAEGLVCSLGAILEYAAAMARRVREDQEVAVHEYRKSLRRARSLVRLLRPVVSGTARRRLATVLKEAHRAASPLRDLDVLLVLIDQYELEGSRARPGAGSALRASLEEQRRERLGRRRADEVLERGVGSILPLPEELARALPDEVEYKQLVRGLRGTYRRARQELDRALDIPDPVHVHSWRKRTKDLSYQLELLASVGGRAVANVRKPYASLAGTLGEVTDLVILRSALDENEELADFRDHERIYDRVDRLLKDRLAAAFKEGRPLFRARPKKLGREIAGLLRR
jgi:CHAD domain-containing protein